MACAVGTLGRGFVVEHNVSHGGELRLHFVQSLVFVSLGTLKPIPVPDDFRAMMCEYLKPERTTDSG